MATITRRLAAELRSVFRRLGGTARGSGPALCISTGPDGMRVSTRICDVAAEYHVPGNLPEEQLPVGGQQSHIVQNTLASLRQIKTLGV